jgi:repressor LexA
MSELTEKQTSVLDFIRTQMNTVHRPPTLREIQTGCGFNNVSTVRSHLHYLMKKGRIRLLPGISRGIELVDG